MSAGIECNFIVGCCSQYKTYTYSEHHDGESCAFNIEDTVRLHYKYAFQDHVRTIIIT